MAQTKTETGPERRKRRSQDTLEALRLQLDACRQDAELEALVLGDEDGLCLACAGDPTYQEVAARVVLATRAGAVVGLGRGGGQALVHHKIENFEGTVVAPERAWNLRMRRFRAAGSWLVLCAVGGGGEPRGREIQRSILGVTRILAAA
jgi:hypothetical protein